MYVIGLGGGIASGKSTVAARIVEQGAVHMSADQLARDAVEIGTPGWHDVRDSFGDGVLLDDGTLDRRALAAHAFADPSALNQLNNIVHPRIKELAKARLEAMARDAPSTIVIFEIPLLAESSETHSFDLIAITRASEPIRVRRMVAFRGMTEEEARIRIRAQAGEQERLNIADVIVDTAGSMHHTRAQADALYERARSEAAT
jgi:dephospho-CoA kinase